MITRVKISEVVYFLFVMVIFCHALAAYSLAGIPLPWVAQLGAVILCSYIFVRDKVFLFPGFNVFLLLFTWALFVTLVNNIFVDYSTMLGGLASTSYELYVFLRFLGLIFFLSSILIVYWLCVNGYQDRLLKSITNLGVFFSVMAIYIYLAQILGLPEIPRNRLGTGGGVASTTYTYAFHRAVGTFREPSHLAEWLVVPFFLSYISAKSWWNIKGLIMGGVLLLTGSLTGVISILAGLFISLVINFKFDAKILKAIAKVFLPVLGAFAIFSVVSLVQGGDGKQGVVSVLWERIEPIIYDDGVHSTNRSYVYKYFESADTPLLGDGLGNSNILFSRHVGIEATVSFLNLFLNMVFSLGVVGLVLLLVFMAYPILYFIILKNNVRGIKPTFLMSGYVAWIFIFIMHSEEFSLYFGIIYALLTYHLLFQTKEKTNA